MSIVNGFMQMNKVNVRNTITTFIMDNPAGIQCGQTMTFTIHTKYITDFISGGTVYIIDHDTKEILGQASNLTGTTDIAVQKISGAALISGIVGEDGYAYLFGDRNVYALFSGVPNVWKSSSSATQKCYVEKAITTIVSDAGNSHTQSIASDGYYQFNIAQSGGAFDYAEGYVDFRLYSNNNTYITLDTWSLVMSNHGHAQARIPIGSMIAGNRYYLSAFYRGNGCLAPSNTNVGVTAFYIDATT
jgi:hypothetical protein